MLPLLSIFHTHLLDLVHELLEALLKLSAVLGARNQQAHVQGHNLQAVVGRGNWVREEGAEWVAVTDWLASTAQLLPAFAQR